MLVKDKPFKVTFVGNSAQMVEYKLRELGKNELLVKAKCSMISLGTEGQALTKLSYDKSFRENPGYALAGDIIDVGKEVKKYKIGDRVVGGMNHCKYAICSEEEPHCVRIPDEVSYEDSTFCILGCVALHGIRRAEVKLGESIAIFGAGIIGLLSLKFAKLAGAYPIICIDLSQKRLDIAKENGADYIINPTDSNVLEKVLEYTKGKRVQVVYEAVGNPIVLQTAFQICATGGRTIVLGNMTEAPVTLDIMTDFIERQQSLIASQQPNNLQEDNIYYHFGRTISLNYILDLIRRKKLNVSHLITHRFRFKDAPKIYDLIKTGKTNDYKGKTCEARDMIGVIIDWIKEV